MKKLTRLFLAVTFLNLSVLTPIYSDDRERSSRSYDTGRSYSLQEFQRMQNQQRSYTQPKIPDINTLRPKLDISYDINSVLGTTWRYTAENLGYNATKELTSFKLTVFDVSNSETRKLVSDINIKAYGDDRKLKPAQYTEILNYASGAKLTRQFTNGNYEPSERWMNFKEEYARAVQQTNRQKMTMMNNMGEPDSFILKSFTDTLLEGDQKKLTRNVVITSDEKDRIKAVQAEFKDMNGGVLNITLNLFRDASNSTINGFTLDMTSPEGLNYHQEFLNQAPDTIKDKLNMLATSRIPVLVDDLSMIRIKDLKMVNLPELPNKDGNPEPILTLKELAVNIQKQFEPVNDLAVADIDQNTQLPRTKDVQVSLAGKVVNGLADTGANAAEWLINLLDTGGDKLGNWTGKTVKSDEMQVAIGFSYGLVEGMATGFGADCIGGALQLPKFMKELMTNFKETTNAIAESLGISYTELKTQLSDLANGRLSNYEGGRFIGNAVGRMIGWGAGASLTAKGISVLAKTSAGQVLIELGGKTPGVKALNNIASRINNTKAGRITQAVSDLLNKETNLKNVINDFVAGVDKIKSEIVSKPVAKLATVTTVSDVLAAKKLLFDKEMGSGLNRQFKELHWNEHLNNCKALGKEPKSFSRWNSEYDNTYRNVVSEGVKQGKIILHSQEMAIAIGKLDSPVYTDIINMLQERGFAYKGYGPLYTDVAGNPITKNIPQGMKPSVSEIWVHPDDLSVVRVDPLGNPTGRLGRIGNNSHVHFDSWDAPPLDKDMLKFNKNGNVEYVVEDTHKIIKNNLLSDEQMNKQIMFNSENIFDPIEKSYKRNF